MDTLDSPIETATEFPLSLKQYLIIIAALVIFNVSSMTHLFRQYSKQPLFASSMLIEVLIMPLFSMIIGLLLASMPYKKLGYKTKYWPSVLLGYLIINALWTMAIVYGMGRTILTGHYDQILHGYRP